MNLLRFSWWPTLGVAAFSTVVGIPVRATPAHAATEVNTCNQTFSGSGFLSADLDCTGAPGPSIVIQGGSLDLGGFKLTAGEADGVRCEKSCQVFSDPPGGQILASTPISGGIYGISPSNAPVRVKVSGVLLDGDGVQSALGNVLIEDSMITNARTEGAYVVGGRSVKVINSTIDTTGLGFPGVVGDRVTIVDSFILNAGELGVSGGDRARIRGSTISGSAEQGVFATVLRLRDTDVTGNGGSGVFIPTNLVVVGGNISGNAGRGIEGVQNGKVTLKGGCNISGNGLDGVFHSDRLIVENCTITSNGRNGINMGMSPSAFCRTLHLVDSTVTGNGTDGAVCGVSETCADLAVCGAGPILDGSICDTSYNTDSGFPGANWGVCSLD